MDYKIQSASLNLLLRQVPRPEGREHLASARGTITAIIGPSGCGKSTLLRCFNRMNELIAGVRISGQILLDGQDIYRPDSDLTRPAQARGHGLPAAQPVSAVGLRQRGLRPARPRHEAPTRIWSRSSRRACGPPLCGTTLKDRLHAPALDLSAEQQQRLCISRLVAVEPEVLLMDEPCSALDPDRHRAHRGADAPACRAVYHRHRDA